MQIFEKALSDIKPYENNPRNNDNAVSAVVASICEFGFKVPIVIDSDGVIVCGHTRYKAAQEIGLKTVPCVIADDLTPEQVKAFRLADNKVGELATWDFEKLELETAELETIELEKFGFDDDALDKEKSETTKTEVTEDDYEKELPKESKTKKGDIYQLGAHRLMCGDSTDTKTVKKLMNGDCADICFTSPPYNMGRSKMHKVENVSMNLGNGSPYQEYCDDVSDEEYSNLLHKTLENALTFADDALYNIGILAGSKKGITKMLDDFSDKFCDVVVWKKRGVMPLGLPSQSACISHICELIFCFNQTGTRCFSHPQWKVGNGTNCIETENNSANDISEHHAAFPVAFAFEVLKNYTSESVLDLFGGTGTTMIAAEQLGRKCYMMELDPHYIDLIIDRWEKFTGQKARKIND